MFIYTARFPPSKVVYQYDDDIHELTARPTYRQMLFQHLFLPLSLAYTRAHIVEDTRVSGENYR